MSIVEFVNKYPRMKKSAPSLNFLKNNFKVIKETCRENASEFRQVWHFLNKFSTNSILKLYKK